MPKVPPRGLPASTATMNRLRKWYQDLDLDPVEIRVIHLILLKGKHLRWTMFIGRNFADETALALGVHPSTFKEKLAKLIKRGWLKKGIDDVGRSYMQLTGKFIDDCERAEQRWWVKFTLGSNTWQKINGTDEMADLLYQMSSAAPPSREFTISVKEAVHEVAESDLASSGSRSPKATWEVAESDFRGRQSRPHTHRW